jgi:hypothetical protein
MENKISTLLILLFAGCSLMAQPVITIDYKCDSARLSYVAPDDGMVYYWQGTSCGELLDDSNPTFKVTASGTYYLRAYNTTSSTWAATDCSTAIVALAQYPTEPPVPVYESGNLVLQDPPDSVTYYAQGSSCGISTGSPGTIFPVSSSGTYYFNAFNSEFNCWSAACTSINLIITDIDNNLDNRIKIVLSPVPAIDQMRISLPENITRVDLDVYDHTGRIILSKKNLYSSDVIDISALHKGSYIARFRGNNIDESQKIIINR